MILTVRNRRPSIELDHAGRFRAFTISGTTVGPSPPQTGEGLVNHSLA
jgi:hypothetical protein